jgi:HD-like signal output (HDOD) protein
MMTTMKRVLFVDDEPEILAGLKNLLYRERKRWDLVFAQGGQHALEEVRRAPFDVVVTDMRMPELDGAALLNIIKAECPATVRIMLSGQADRELIIRALPAVHQLLSKPCDVAVLRDTLERSLSGIDVAHDAAIRRIIGGIDNLPTPPDVFFALSRLMQSATSSATAFAEVVRRDPALTAKILQLVNSGFFATGRTTTSIQDAVVRIGTEQLRYIALTASVFSTTDVTREVRHTLDTIQRTAISAARLAGALAEPAERDRAFASALLHDIGRLVLALARPADFAGCGERIDRGEDVLDVEREVFGVDHAQIGSRLLAIWGLPSAIVDAVQYHHDPGSAPEAARRLTGLVHVVDALVSSARLDPESLDRAGCTAQVATWRAAAERLASAR